MCGIFGQINHKRQGGFNYPAFTTLGIFNDSRGGDSCGVFIDGDTEYGVDKHKLFTSFMDASKVIKSAKKCHIALGHCRKASVGAIDEEHAQPVVIKEEGEVKFVVMHNGTIYNYEQLAKKYIPHINITGMTDSQVMTNIFYHSGYDALSEYNGGAVFVIVDYREKSPKVLVFKGESKLYHTSAKAAEERPFYFVNTKESFFFSSLMYSLKPFSEQEEIWTVYGNQLVEISDTGELIEVKNYSRDNCIQTKESNYSSYYSPYSKKLPFYDSDDYYAYQEYYDDYNPYSSYTSNSKNTNTAVVSTTSNPTDTRYDLTKLNDGLDYDDLGRYYYGRKLLHGCSIFTLDGTLGYSDNTAKPYFFWYGYLLKNKECFNTLTNLCKENSINPETLIDIFPSVVFHLCMTPIIESHSDGTYELRNYVSPYASIPYSGSMPMLGTKTVLMCTSGVMVSQEIQSTYSEMLRCKVIGDKFRVPTELINSFIKSKIIVD